MSKAEVMFEKLCGYCCQIGYTGIVEVSFDKYEALVRSPKGEVERLLFSSECGWH